MLFGGIQKTSLIDFPGKIACILFTPGCNFTCPYCHNGALAKNRMDLLSPLSESEAIRFLEGRKGLLEGVVITGGEPTLHEGLGPFCDAVKEMGFSVKLDTNGSNPGQLSRLLSARQVDYVAMDIKTDPAAYSPHLFPSDLTNTLTESVQAILSSGVSHEFRTTCLYPFVDDRIIAGIASLISGADLYVLQAFKKGDVLDPDFIEAHTAPCTREDLIRFQAIAAQSVKDCLIR
jgi:pyruvate formate lyase activating enzyme